MAVHTPDGGRKDNGASTAVALGSVVRIRGLVSGSGKLLNGLEGMATDYFPEGDRWAVSIPGSAPKKLKDANLEVVEYESEPAIASRASFEIRQAMQIDVLRELQSNVLFLHFFGSRDGTPDAIYFSKVMGDLDEEELAQEKLAQYETEADFWDDLNSIWELAQSRTRQGSETWKIGDFFRRKVAVLHAQYADVDAVIEQWLADERPRIRLAAKVAVMAVGY